MRLQINHRTRYEFGTRVKLQPHIVRLTPRTDAAQRLLRFELDIEPAPAGSADLVDLNGTPAVHAWFDSETTELVIETEAEVETLRSNPFDYVWIGDSTLPFRYQPNLVPELQPFMVEGRADAGVRDYALEVARGASDDAQVVLPALAAAMHRRFRQTYRAEGAALAPAITLRQTEGSCRDLTLLFTAAARSLGFACRFVSGYLAFAGEEGSELHAWAEAYIPGGGWRGFDPSTGLACADEHIAVAAAADARHAAPVTGRFWSGAESKLEAHVSVRQLAEI